MAADISMCPCYPRALQLLCLAGGLQTSNASPPLPMMPLRPFTKSAVGPESSSRLLVQSSFPVARSTCSVYGAIVFNSGVLRSMSRSGGAAAHAHVGDGHVSMYGIDCVGDCRRGVVVVKARKLRIQGTRARDRRRKAADMFVVVEGRRVEDPGKLSDPQMMTRTFGDSGGLGSAFGLRFTSMMKWCCSLWLVIPYSEFTP
jgi:hypothetical protein